MATEPFKVLVVDDTEAQRYAIARTLRSQGFAVDEASTGAHALETAKNAPDLILLDIVLPDVDGFEVCRRLKADPTTSQIPVIQISANFVDPEHRVHGFQGGADDYIAQPITPEELVAKIGVWLRVRRAEEELRRKNVELARAYAQLVSNSAESDARRRLYETVLSNTPDLVYVFDLNHRFTYANDSLLRMWGRSWDEAIGKNCLELGYEPWHATMHDREIDQVVTTKQAIKGEVPFSGTYGRRLYEYIFVPVFGPDGNVEAVAGTTRDVTERRETENQHQQLAEQRQDALNALRKSEQRLRFHMENTPLAVIEWGADFRLSRWSGEAERIFGWRAEEVLGKRMTDFRWIYEDDIDRVDEVSNGLRTGTYPRSMSSNRNYRKDGSVAYCEWYNSSLVDESGKLVSIMSLVLDVTEREQAHEALVRSEKLASVGRMAASVAHEINNPLEAVMNLVFLAQSRAECPPEIREFLSTANTELKRISHVTRQVLGFYKGSAAPERISVLAAIDDAVELYEPRMRTRRITVERQYREPVFIRAIGGELRQVLSNLIANSLEASSDGGMIKIRASESKLRGTPGVRITVADNGTGIKPAAVPYVFEPLFTTKEAIGTGLGLWISKQLVEKHGGSIRFRTSTNPARRGTTFSILFPADLEPPNTPSSR